MHEALTWARARLWPTGLARRTVDGHMGGEPRLFLGWRNRSRRMRSGYLSHTQTACRLRGPLSPGRDWQRRRVSRRMRTWRRCRSPLSGKGPRPSRSLPSRSAARSFMYCQRPLPPEAYFLVPATVLSLYVLGGVTKAPPQEDRTLTLRQCTVSRKRAPEKDHA